MSWKIMRVKDSSKDAFKYFEATEFILIGDSPSDGQYCAYLGNNGTKYSINKNDLEPVPETNLESLYTEDRYKNVLRYGDERSVYRIGKWIKSRKEKFPVHTLCEDEELPSLIAALVKLYEETLQVKDDDE